MIMTHYTESRFHIISRDGYHHGAFFDYESASLWRNRYAPKAAIVLRDIVKSRDPDEWKKTPSPCSPAWEYRTEGSTLGPNG